MNQLYLIRNHLKRQNWEGWRMPSMNWGRYFIVISFVVSLERMMSQQAQFLQYLKQITRQRALNLWGLVHTCSQSLKLTMDSSLIQSINYFTWMFTFSIIYYPIQSPSFSAQTAQFFTILSSSFYSSFISLSQIGLQNSSNFIKSFPGPSDRFESTYNEDFYIDIFRFEQSSLLLKQSLTHLSPRLLYSINLCIQLLIFLNKFFVFVNLGFSSICLSGEEKISSWSELLRTTGQLFSDIYFLASFQWLQFDYISNINSPLRELFPTKERFRKVLLPSLLYVYHRFWRTE